MKFLILLFLFSCASSNSFLPEKTKDSIRFCLVGDVGTGDNTQKRVALAMKESGCERLVLLGDVIYPDGIDSPDDPQLKNKFHKHYKDFPKIYIVLGNHDYRGDIKAWTKLGERDARIIHPGNYYLEKINDTCFFFLDSNFDDDPKLFEVERQWLRKNSSDCKMKYGFTHHPYHSTGVRHGSARGQMKEFFESEVIGKFDAVFSGHEHFLIDYGTFSGTRLIISGAGGKHEKGLPGFATLDFNLKDPKKSTINTIYL